MTSDGVSIYVHNNCEVGRRVIADCEHTLIPFIYVYVMIGESVLFIVEEQDLNELTRKLYPVSVSKCEITITFGFPKTVGY